MHEVSDGIDLAVTVLMFLLMLSVCVYALTSIRASSYLTVDERTSVHNMYGTEVQEPEPKTAEDALIMLVVNDQYAPYPSKVQFQSTGFGGKDTTVSFDTDFFGNKNSNINMEWTNYFSTEMNRVVKSIQLAPNYDYWIVTLQ